MENYTKKRTSAEPVSSKNQHGPNIAQSAECACQSMTITASGSDSAWERKTINILSASWGFMPSGVSISPTSEHFRFWPSSKGSISMI
jgi:hypothetical protein